MQFSSGPIGRLEKELLIMSKKEKKKHAVERVEFVATDAREVRSAQVGAELAELTVQGTILARDLVNTPSGHMQPAVLAETARRIAKESKGAIQVKVYDEAALKKMGAGGLLGISQGSDHPPVLVHMRYTPRGAKKRISLVGKAVTFDSGGLSIKPAEAMYPTVPEKPLIFPKPAMIKRSESNTLPPTGIYFPHTPSAIVCI